MRKRECSQGWNRSTPNVACRQPRWRVLLSAKHKGPPENVSGWEISTRKGGAEEGNIASTTLGLSRAFARVNRGSTRGSPRVSELLSDESDPRPHRRSKFEGPFDPRPQANRVRRDASSNFALPRDARWRERTQRRGISDFKLTFSNVLRN